jgi:hypothetical protein
VERLANSKAAHGVIDAMDRLLILGCVAYAVSMLIWFWLNRR